MTMHPRGGTSSGEFVHEESWVDFNMFQSGHGAGRDVACWDMVTRDLDRQPPKPTLDGEPNYEDHPVNPWPKWDPADGYFRDHDVRKQTYRSVFAGACGVTYGHHFVWQMYDTGREPCNNGGELMTWREAIARPGACQMQHLRKLMLSRPYLSRIPDQTMLAGTEGDGADHARATRDNEGSYAMVYMPSGKQVTVDLSSLTGDTLATWWYDPRTGRAMRAEDTQKGPKTIFVPPQRGPDWVLVLEDSTRGRGAPGA
jgi:hypothetical protein